MRSSMATGTMFVPFSVTAVFTSAPFLFSMAMRSSALYAGVHAQTPSKTVLFSNIVISPLCFQTGTSITQMTSECRDSTRFASQTAPSCCRSSHSGKQSTGLFSDAVAQGFESLPSKAKRNSRLERRLFLFVVGVSGFEPEASCSRSKRDTKLRHTPMCNGHYYKGNQA